MAKKKKKKATKATKKVSKKKTSRGYGTFGKAAGPKATVTFQKANKIPRHKLNIGALLLDNYHFVLQESDLRGLSMRNVFDRILTKLREDGVVKLEDI